MKKQSHQIGNYFVTIASAKVIFTDHEMFQLLLFCFELFGKSLDLFLLPGILLDLFVVGIVGKENAVLVSSSLQLLLQLVNLLVVFLKRLKQKYW